MEGEACRLCDRTAEVTSWVDGFDSVRVDCQLCGPYEFSNTLDMVKGSDSSFDELRRYLSCHVRQMMEKGTLCERFDTYNWRAIAEKHRSTSFLKKAELAMDLIAKRSEGKGHQAVFLSESDAFLLDVTTKLQMGKILSELQQRGLARYQIPWGVNGSVPEGYSAELTFAGWEEVERRREQAREPEEIQDSFSIRQRDQGTIIAMFEPGWPTRLSVGAAMATILALLWAIFTYFYPSPSGARGDIDNSPGAVVDQSSQQDVYRAGRDIVINGPREGTPKPLPFPWISTSYRVASDPRRPIAVRPRLIVRDYGLNIVGNERLGLSSLSNVSVKITRPAAVSQDLQGFHSCTVVDVRFAEFDNSQSAQYLATVPLESDRDITVLLMNLSARGGSWRGAVVMKQAENGLETTSCLVGRAVDEQGTERVMRIKERQLGSSAQKSVEYDVECASSFDAPALAELGVPVRQLPVGSAQTLCD